MLLEVVAAGLMEVAEEGLSVLELFKLPLPVPTPLGVEPDPRAVPTPVVEPEPVLRLVPVPTEEEVPEPLRFDPVAVVPVESVAALEEDPAELPPTPEASAPPAPTP
jgi:hypothetical protein